MSNGYRWLRPLIHRMPPETAHALALLALKMSAWPSSRADEFPALSVHALGLDFLNPVGLAAGFDKNAEALNGLLAQGFGFVEAGTVTPKPQAGNPRPRIFRLPEDEAVINRLGFNNRGLDAFTRNFQARRGGIVGANIGKNKDSIDAADDYVKGLNAVYPHADYITVNISSPNTPGLRSLQKREALEQLLAALGQAHSSCAAQYHKRVPLLLKIAPDLEEADKANIAALILGDYKDTLSGLIISNTTVTRPDFLKSPHAKEQGGLSGKPLFDLSTRMLADMYRLTGGKVMLIGAGGISCAEDAYAKIRHGATLVQLYTAIIYHGFGIINEINQGLAKLLERDGFVHVGEAVGVDVK